MGDKPSVVPVGTEFLFDQPYPGLTVLGYFHAVPSGRRAGRAIVSVSLSLKNLFWTSLGENSSDGALHQEKLHFAEAGSDKVIVKAL